MSSSRVVTAVTALLVTVLGTAQAVAANGAPTPRSQGGQEVERVQAALASTADGVAGTEASPGRRGLWYAIGDTPTPAEVDAAPRRYGVVVLNPWETWALHRLKRLDPTVVVLMYQCLASTRDDADAFGGPLPSGVGYAEAEAAGPGWFAEDSTGRRVPWGPYAGHWQMAVWNPTYQQRWVDNVVRAVTADSWDGVLADNDLYTLRWYTDSLLAGTTSAAETDELVRTGLRALVDSAGSALSARGKLLVPNVSDGRLEPGRWDGHTRYGGGMEENLAHWGTDPASGFLWDWADTGWRRQAAELAGPGLSLSVTRAAPGDHRSLLYGYGTVLVRGDRNAYWAPSTTAAGDYSAPEYLAEMSWTTGAPTTGARRLTSGAWTRTFEGLFAAVNPTQRTIKVAVPRTFVDGTGQVVTTVTLRPTSAAVLRRTG